MPETLPPPTEPAAAPAAGDDAFPADPPPPAAAGEPGADPFSGEEYRQFAAEDGRAGTFIGWLLCVLFVYTILVASAAIWWTLNAG